MRFDWPFWKMLSRAWSLQSALLIGFALATGLWVFALISMLSSGLSAVGNVIWGTLTSALVPDAVRGRVASFDWLVSIGLIPVSFALTGPIATAAGASVTLWVAGALGAVTMIAFLAVPGLRDPERQLAAADTAPVAV